MKISQKFSPRILFALLAFSLILAACDHDEFYSVNILSFPEEMIAEETYVLDMRLDNGDFFAIRDSQTITFTEHTDGLIGKCDADIDGVVEKDSYDNVKSIYFSCSLTFPTPGSKTLFASEEGSWDVNILSAGEGEVVIEGLSSYDIPYGEQADVFVSISKWDGGEPPTGEIKVKGPVDSCMAILSVDPSDETRAVGSCPVTFAKRGAVYIKAEYVGPDGDYDPANYIIHHIVGPFPTVLKVGYPLLAVKEDTDYSLNITITGGSGYNSMPYGIVRYKPVVDGVAVGDWINTPQLQSAYTVVIPLHSSVLDDPSVQQIDSYIFSYVADGNYQEASVNVNIPVGRNSPDIHLDEVSSWEVEYGGELTVSFHATDIVFSVTGSSLPVHVIVKTHTCTVDLVENEAVESCSMTLTHPGVFPLALVLGGNSYNFSDFEILGDITVLKNVPILSLESISTREAVVGDEITFTVLAENLTDDPPQPVTVNLGSLSCEVILNEADGLGSCTLTATETGTLQVLLSMPEDENNAPVETAAGDVTVSLAPIDLELVSVSPSVVESGNLVTLQFGATSLGLPIDIDLYAFIDGFGCQAFIVDGVGSCEIELFLAEGTYDVEVIFDGSDDYSPAEIIAGPVVVTVAEKITTDTSILWASPATAVAGDFVTFGVFVNGSGGPQPPEGIVEITGAGGSCLATIDPEGNGACVIQISGSGALKITATFEGDNFYQGSSATMTFTTTADAPVPEDDGGPPPLPDEDGDGVPDADDKCKGTNPGLPVDADGCV